MLSISIGRHVLLDTQSVKHHMTHGLVRNCSRQKTAPKHEQKAYRAIHLADSAAGLRLAIKVAADGAARVYGERQWPVERF